MRTLKLLLASILAPAALGLLLAEPPSDPAAVAPLLNQAEALAAQGKHGAAAEALQNALKVSPGVESIRFRLASQMVFQRRYDEAAALYQSLAASSNPALAAMAKNSLNALADEKLREAAQKQRQAAFQIRDAELKRDQAAKERTLRASEADLRERQAIYDQFQAGHDRDGLAHLEKYGSSNPIPPDLQYAAVFALQRLREFPEAGRMLDAMPDDVKSSPAWLLAHARNQRALGRMAAAWDGFSRAEAASVGTPLEAEILREIDSLPAEYDLRRWAWGELQLDAQYLTRFSDAIFYGQIREGTFVPGARWIQPFVQLDFTLDTKSGVVDGLSQVYANNLAGGHAGIRLRLIPNEEIWIYGLLGIQKDLRGTTRFRGDWFLDWRAGIRGYKGVGPGLNFLKESSLVSAGGAAWEIRPRLAWLAEGGWDAAWYSLYENFIAYGQLREGFRVLEAGGWLGVDAYALQQGTLDSLGLYYNNFFEAGGGLRATVRLQRSTSLIARAEYLGGAYLGTNAENSRGTLPATYTDLRITVSLWSEW